MGSRGIRAAELTSEGLRRNPDTWKLLDPGKYQVIFATPEILLSPRSFFWHRMAAWKTHPFLKRLSAIVLDEAHCVWKWGESGFRSDYKNIGNLRVYFPKTPFLLLSATMAPNVLTYLHTTLGLGHPTVLQKRSIVRSNLKVLFARTRAPAGDYGDLDFLVDPLKPAAGLIPKTMVFVDSRSVAQAIVNYLCGRLAQELLARDEMQSIICIYSAAHTSATRAEHMRMFLSGDCRILVCTDAAGMGMNIPNIQVGYSAITHSGRAPN